MRVRLGDSTVDVDEDTAYAGYWRSVDDGRWEPETLALVASLAGPGVRVADIGAWVGPVTLAAAAAGAEVHAYEPDPVALAGLERNVARNEGLRSRITVHPYGLGATTGSATIVAPELGTSVSSLVRRDGERRPIELRRFDDEARTDALARADVVKVDIEGGEYLVLASLARYLARRRPTLILSTHVTFLRERVKPSTPRPVRLAVLGVLSLRQLRIPARLRGYRHWYEARDGTWVPLGRVARWRRFLSFDDKEFVLAAAPVVIARPRR